MRYLVIVVLIVAIPWRLINLANAEVQPSQPEPSNQTQQNDSCRWGPTWLNQVDTWERENNSTTNWRYRDKSISAETYAEILIMDCSELLSRMSAALQLLDDNRTFKAIVAMNQKNLDYMKWWLQNRRAKKQDR